MQTHQVLVLGASEDGGRYSNMAVKQLKKHHHMVTAVGKHSGNIEDIPILTSIPEGKRYHTITLYLNPMNQRPYEDQLIALKPERIIFNPGTENPSFEQKLSAHGIAYLRACTLVLLSTGQF